MPHRVEHFVAEIDIQELVVIADGFDQTRAVGVAVNAEEFLALLPRAVRNFGKDRVLASQDSALKIALLACQIAHRPKSLIRPAGAAETFARSPGFARPRQEFRQAAGYCGHAR